MSIATSEGPTGGRAISKQYSSALVSNAPNANAFFVPVDRVAIVVVLLLLLLDLVVNLVVGEIK
jgi:hypothetical protein